MMMMWPRSSTDDSFFASKFFECQLVFIICKRNVFSRANFLKGLLFSFFMILSCYTHSTLCCFCWHLFTHSEEKNMCIILSKKENFTLCYSWNIYSTTYFKTKFLDAICENAYCKCESTAIKLEKGLAASMQFRVTHNEINFCEEFESAATVLPTLSKNLANIANVEYFIAKNVRYLDFLRNWSMSWQHWQQQPKQQKRLSLH